MSRPMGSGEEAAVQWIQKLFKLIGSPHYPTASERLQARALESYRRAWHPPGSARQLLAIAADGDRTPWLSTLHTPTLVIHGMADPMVPLECGQQLARHIRGAETDFIEGMGHDLPLELLERIAFGIAKTSARAVS